eukprot:gene16899-35067_t
MKGKVSPYYPGGSGLKRNSRKPNPCQSFFISILKQFRSISASAGDEVKVRFNKLQTSRGCYHENDSKLFKYATIDSDLEKLKDALFKDPDLIKDRDPLGASVIHCAYIYNISKILTNKPLRRWLVSNFPEEALEPFSASTKDSKEIVDKNYILPFAGENILHICIVNRDIDEIIWLFDHFDKSKDSDGELCINRLLNGRAYG